MPTVAIVIVCYNGIADTIECLDSVARLTYADIRVVVVDNASADGTAAMVRERFPNVQLLEADDNLGYAGGNNLGIRYALDVLQAAYVLLLNNDTTTEPGMLEPLVAYAEANPDAGILGPLMCYYDAPDTVWASGGTVDRRAASRLIDNGDGVCDISEQPIESGFIIGCGMLVRRDVWESVGLFDERYFLYYEDSDLCSRAEKAGYRSVTIPSARLYHKVSRSTGAGSNLTLYYMRRNALLFLKKNGGLSGRIAALADDLRLFLVLQIQGDSRRAAVLWTAVADYFAGRFGRKNAS